MRRIALLILAAIIVVAALLASLLPSRTVTVDATTTTSLYQTGLLEALASDFRSTHSGVTIRFIAVGSGEALARAARGDACLVLVHAPSLEKKYIEEGVLEDHRIIASNYFVIVGPESDPANVSGARSPVEAFQRIYRAGEEGRALFVSRGDRSGTHVRELSLWRLAGLSPEGRPWYLEAGQGMSETLVIAAEKGAYTLSDIGTYLKLSREGRLPGMKILYSGGKELINVYSAYLVSSCSGRERSAAKAFLDYLVSERGQRLIGSYGADKYGEPLFYKAMGNETMLREAWEWLAGQG